MLVIAAITVSVTDVIMFYVIWSGRTQITPLFVFLVIIITMVPIGGSISGFTFSNNLARHPYRSSQKVSVEWSTYRHPLPEHVYDVYMNY